LVFLSAKHTAAPAKALIELAGEEYKFSLKEKVLYYRYSKSTMGNDAQSIWRKY